jgi:hypothetical protein
MFRSSAKDPIEIAQRVLEGNGTHLGTTFIDAIDAIVQQSLWQERCSATKEPFSDFGEFARAERPYGLGVADRAAWRLLRFALLERSHYRALTDLIRRFARGPGQPVGTLANGEDCFYRAPTSFNAIDRILLTLYREHPDLLEEVCQGRLTPRQAGIRAGFIPPATRKLKYGACDLEKARRLSSGAQGDLLCELFATLPLDAQCALLSRRIEPVLGPGLTEKWRNGTHN